MRVTLAWLVLSILAVGTEATTQRCVTELNAHPGSGVVTVSQPAETVTLYKNDVSVAAGKEESRLRAPKVAAAARTSTRYSISYQTDVYHATKVARTESFTPTNLIIRAAATITRTAQAVVGTTTLYITTGPTGGTTTITSYTNNVPAPSLAKPVLQRREQIEPRQTQGVQRRSNNGTIGQTNGVDITRFQNFDDDPSVNRGSTEYCSDVLTATLDGPAPTAFAEPSPLARRADGSMVTVIETITAKKTVTVWPHPTPRATVTALAISSSVTPKPVTVTYTPTTKILTKTSYVPAAPTATVVVGGLDVCKPTKFSKLYDWTAYQAEALAFGITSFADISDPATCCAAAANKPGALAWALCDDTNDLHESCQKGVKGPCFVTYLKTIPGYTTAQDQCQTGNNATTFQYRAGTGQIGGPLQCASTYTPYNCFRPVLLLLGDYICLKA
ncbi:hypothetical protein CF326_g384 [Tilletia indica]|nr:hypothetical protein CF326_g384 [Tilletia indica]